MNDDAVAPVIAVMLILAAIVTFLSIWNAVYVPSMKQSAEIGHLQNVESAFVQFSSDIETAVSMKKDLSFSKQVQLGGGDFIFNSLRSSGSLHVQNEPYPIYNLTLSNETSTVLQINGTLVNISYQPQGNFWQDQGYQWQYGYINVTKYQTLQTPLSYYTMTDVNNQFEGDGSLAAFARSFVAVEHTKNQSSQYNTITINNTTTTTVSQMQDYCSGIDLFAVTISASPDQPFVSSNGFGTLKITTAVHPITYLNVTGISFGLGGSEGSDTVKVFRNTTGYNWNDSFAKGPAKYCTNNIIYNASSTAGFSWYNINQTMSPVTVNLHIVEIRISAY
jgi:hypothetical protein